MDKRSFRLEFTALLFLLLAAISSSAQSRRVAPTPTPTPEADERIDTEEVKLNVIAFDEAGNFVPDVTEKDLVITEDNVLHQPTSVKRIPANVLILLDTGGEMRFVKSLDRTRRIAAALVNSLKDTDSISVMQYSDKPEVLSEWTSDKSQTIDAIKKRTNFGRRSAFVQALNLATDLLVRNPVENKHLVLITDGTDSLNTSSDKFDAIQRLLATSISVHVISYAAMEAEDITPRTEGISNSPPPKAMPDEIAATLPNGVKDVATAPKFKTINLDRTMIKKLKARKSDLENSSEQMQKLSDETNGEFISPNNIDEMIAKAPLVAKMIDASYSVTYTPKTPVRENRGIAERNIQVTSKRAGLIVDARRKLLLKRD